MYLETFAAQRASKSTFVESEERLHGAAQASVGAAGDAGTARKRSKKERRRGRETRLATSQTVGTGNACKL